MRRPQALDVKPRRSRTAAASVATVAMGAMLAMLGMAACDGPTEPKTPDGSYKLNTVNGRALPATIFQEPGYTVAVLDGTLDLAADGRFSALLTTREVVDNFPSTYPDSSSGTWVRLPQNVVAFVIGTDTTRGVWAGRTLTFDVPTGSGQVTSYVYGRR